MCGLTPLHLIILFVYFQSALLVRHAGEEVRGSKRCSNVGRLLRAFIFSLIFLATLTMLSINRHAHQTIA